jgi:ectonucleotide pyrophosphatase/phosphodiesterase family member 5
MPQLSELIETGTFYPQARAQMVAETTPNHVSMLTGMRVNRHGLPGNSAPFIDSNTGFEPRRLQADSIFTLARRQAPELLTASVTAKTYLVSVQTHDRTGDGEEDATDTNRVSTAIPVDESARDVETGLQALMASRELDPDFLFLNLGDVDRMGHVDESGSLTDGEVPVGRTLVLQTADAQIRLLVESLKSEGWWESTVFIVTADHSMDWSLRTNVITLQPAFAEDPLLAGEVEAAANGGACLYALRMPGEPRAPERLRRIREIALATEGIEEALYIRPNPADGGDAHTVGRVHPGWGLLGDRSGDIIVTVQPGYRIGHAAIAQQGNPIPGNHGHPTTLPIPFVVSGGWSGLAAPRVVDAGGTIAPADRDPSQAENIDVAPTVAWLLGLNPPPGGFDGRVLSEAFAERPSPRVPVANVASIPLPRRLPGADRYATAALLSALAHPDGANTVVIASGEDFADALAATPLAVDRGAPLLLAARDRLTAATAEEVDRLGPDVAIIVGGTGALSEQVEADLIAAGVPEDGVMRLAGSDRFDTARLIAAELLRGDNGDPSLRQALLVVGQRPDGDAFADALAAGPFAARGKRPILLTSPDAIPAATREAMEELELQRIIIGGGTAVVSQAIEDELRAAGMMVERIAGEDRYETARLFAERHIREGGLTDDLYLVSGANYPDALAAGAAVGVAGGTLLLSPPDALAPATRLLLRDRADHFVRVNYVGGAAALSTDLEVEVGVLLASRRSRPVS